MYLCGFFFVFTLILASHRGRAGCAGGSKAGLGGEVAGTGDAGPTRARPGARSGAGAEEGQGGVMTLLWQLSSKPLPREAESPAAGARMRAAVRRARPRTVTGG